MFGGEDAGVMELNTSTLKIEVINSSEKSIDFHWTTERCIPEDITLYSPRCENLKSNIIELLPPPAWNGLSKSAIRF
jgi:hypothetical protein